MWRCPAGPRSRRTDKTNCVRPDNDSAAVSDLRPPCIIDSVDNVSSSCAEENSKEMMCDAVDRIWTEAVARKRRKVKGGRQVVISVDH